MKANQEKCHVLSILDLNTSVSLENYVIKNTKSQKLLEITIDNKLTFNKHVSNFCDKTNKKTNALEGI